MVDRMLRAVKADVSLYEEVEANPTYNQEALTIVGIIAVISAVAGVGLNVILGSGTGGIISGIWSGASVFIGYYVWSYLTYFVGTRMFNGTADVGELQRTLAYSMSPQVLSFIPIVGFLAGLYSLYLGFIAVRQALDFDNQKALMTAGIAWLIWFVISIAIGSAIAALAIGASAVTG